MEPQPDLPRSRASGGDGRAAAIQLAAASLAEKSPSFHFLSSDGGHPVLSRNASRPCPRGRAGRRGRVAARVSPCAPKRSSENSELLLLMQSG